MFLLALALSCGGGASNSGDKAGADQKLQIWLAGEPQSIDPNRAAFAGDVSVIKQVFRGLLSFDQDLTLTAMAAKELPSTNNGGISFDGRTYTFVLREDLIWSDGQPLTARDFVYSVKRLLDPATASPYASFYYDIVGAEEFNSSETADASLKNALRDSVGVKADGDRTLAFTLKDPNPSFLHLMALWPVFPVRADIIEAHGEGWTEPGNLVGNGPFVLKEWEHQDRIVLGPNPNWWGDEVPKLGEVTFRIITDRIQAYNAYLTGQLDYVEVPPEQKDAVKRDPQLRNENVVHDEAWSVALLFNNRRPPFDDPKVRQAFSLACDRDSLLNVVYRGIGRTALSWIPPGVPGYDSTLGLQWRFDAEKAGGALAAAGYPGGNGLPKITFSYPQTGAIPLLAQFVQEQFKRHLGVDIALEPLEPRAFQRRVVSGDFQFTLLSWKGDYPDPSAWLPEIWGCSNYEDGVCQQFASNNLALYANPDFDRLIQQASTELDPGKRLEAYKKAQETLINDAPAIFVVNRSRDILIKPYVKDLVRTSLDQGFAGDFFLEKTYISEK